MLTCLSKSILEVLLSIFLMAAPPQVQDPVIEHPSLCFTEKDVEDVAKVLYAECRGNKSRTEQACVAWVILNRVDAHGSTVHEIVRSPNQFAFIDGAPVLPELYELAHDVLIRWDAEKRGGVSVGRVLPADYQWFHGSGGRNWFKDAYKNYQIWDYSLESPYET